MAVTATAPRRDKFFVPVREVAEKFFKGLHRLTAETTAISALSLDNDQPRNNLREDEEEISRTHKVLVAIRNTVSRGFSRSA